MCANGGAFGAAVPVPANTPNFFIGKFPPAGTNRINRDDPALADLAANAYAAPLGDQACAAWSAFNTYMIKNSIALPWVAQTYNWYAKTGTFNYTPFGLVLDPPSVLRLK